MMANTFISKEQFCRDYHVGKATALWLIQTGLLPAIDTGRKTGRYLIADTDIQTYLHQRELDPKKYRYKGTPPSSSGVSLKPRQARAALMALWSDIPDLLRLRDDISTCAMCAIGSCDQQVSGLVCLNAVKAWLLAKAGEYLTHNLKEAS